jgi:hypothetical protein
LLALGLELVGDCALLHGAVAIQHGLEVDLWYSGDE